MNQSSIDILVGAFVAIGLAALLFLALKVGNLNSFSFTSTYLVTAHFQNVGGLKVRAPVKSAGVVIGRITQINFDDKAYQATVIMALDKRYQFPKDSSIKILTSGLLGEQYIGLEAGGDNGYLTEGSVIDTTQSAMVLEDLIGQFLFKKAVEAGSSKTRK